MNVFLICAETGDKTDSSKSCTEFIVAFVAVSFLKVFILILCEVQSACGGGGPEEFSPLED